MLVYATSFRITFLHALGYQAFGNKCVLFSPQNKPVPYNESNGDTDKDEKWTEIIGGMTIYKDAELKTYLHRAGFHDVQIHKKKSWLCVTAWK